MTVNALTVTKFAEGLYRGPRPVSEADFRTLARGDIKTILDLESYPFDWLGNDRCRAMRLAAVGNGMTTISAPLGAIMPPATEQVLFLIDALHASRKLPAAGIARPVYIHCREGVDRTGMVVAAYRILVERMSVRDAVAEMREMGFHYWRYFWWLPQLRRLADERYY